MGESCVFREPARGGRWALAQLGALAPEQARPAEPSEHAGGERHAGGAIGHAQKAGRFGSHPGSLCITPARSRGAGAGGGGRSGGGRGGGAASSSHDRHHQAEEEFARKERPSSHLKRLASAFGKREYKIKEETERRRGGKK